VVCSAEGSVLLEARPWWLVQQQLCRQRWATVLCVCSLPPEDAPPCSPGHRHLYRLGCEHALKHLRWSAISTPVTIGANPVLAPQYNTLRSRPQADQLLASPQTARLTCY
jgi:hypothetical protein